MPLNADLKTTTRVYLHRHPVGIKGGLIIHGGEAASFSFLEKRKRETWKKDARRREIQSIDLGEREANSISSCFVI